MRLTESHPYWLLFYHKQFPAKKGSCHKTNKAFDRYFTIDDDDSRLLYADALPKSCKIKILSN